MTENKRFSVYGKEIVQGDECWAVAYSEYNADVIATALNELYEENQMLRETLKNQYINEICETCVYGEYWCNYYGEGEFECHKGHKAENCDQLKECDDYELNIKGMNIRMVEE